MILGEAYRGAEAVALPAQEAGVLVIVEVTAGAKGLM